METVIPIAFGLSLLIFSRKLVKVNRETSQMAFQAISVLCGSRHYGVEHVPAGSDDLFRFSDWNIRPVWRNGCNLLSPQYVLQSRNC